MYKPSGVNSKNAIIDLDDVLVDCAGLLCEHFNKIGNHACVDNYREYNFPMYHGLTQEDLISVINDEDVFSNVVMFSGVVDAINKLVANGYGIHFVTSRGAFNDAYEKTHKFLSERSVYFDTLSIVNSTIEKKSSAYKHLIDKSNEILIIDDNLGNLIDAHEHGVCGICIKRPWNTEPNYDFGDSPLLYCDSFCDAVEAILK